MAQATVDTTVTGIQGVPVSATPPTVGQILVFNGTTWVAGTNINGPLTLSGALASGSLATGVITASGTLNVTGNATLTNGLTVGTNLQVNGTINASGNGLNMNGGQITNGGNAAVNAITFGVYPGGPILAFNSYVTGWGGADGPNVQANINGTEFALVTALSQSGTWYPWVNVQTAAGGSLAAANVAQAGTGYQVTWATNNNCDRRMKSNIADPTADALYAIRQLAVHQADQAKPLPKRSSNKVHLDFCFIADEVEKIVPEAVCKHPEPEKGYDILNPLHLVPVLWRAVQILDAEVRALKGAM